MKEGWFRSELKTYIRFIDYRGRTPKKTEEGVRLLTAKNIKLGYLQDNPKEFIAEANYEEWMSRGIPNFGDVIFTTEAPLANVAQLNTYEKVAFAQRVIVMQPDTKILNQTYLKYLLLSPVIREDIISNGTGATVLGIKSSLLKKIQIPIAPLSEQKQIVSILDKAFAAIDQAKANIERNIENAKELFQSKLNEAFSQNGEGWEEKALKDVCGITSKLIDPKEKQYENLLHVGGGNIIAETGELVDLRTTKEEGLKSGKFAFNTEVVLYNKIRPYLVKVTRPNFSGLCSADMYPLTPNKNEITKDFLYFLLISKQFTDYAINGSARAGMPKVNRKHLFEYKFTLPSIEKQKLLTRELDQFRKHCQKMDFHFRNKLSNLEELKKSILQKAFAGELTNADITV